MRRMPPTAWLLGLIPALFVGALATLFFVAGYQPEAAVTTVEPPLSKTSWRDAPVRGGGS